MSDDHRGVIRKSHGFKTKLTEILNMGQPPLKMAIALGLGVLIGLSPLLGLHMFLAVILSKAFKLPVIVAFLGSHISNPLIIPAYYLFAVKFGNHLLQRTAHIPFDWHHASVKTFLTAGTDLLIPFFAGTGAIAPIGAVIAFVVSYPVFKLYRKFKGRRSAQTDTL